MTREVYIVAAKRTAIGSFGGTLSNIPATQLGKIAIEGSLKQSSLQATQIQEVYYGNVLSANLGQAPARQAALKAGLPNTIPCTTVNKVCASGMKSVMCAAQSIQLGYNELVLAGGMENMSMAPFYLEKARFGYKYGEGLLIDGLQKDGLTDAYNHCAMGFCADQTAEKYKVSREEQDQYTIASYQKAAEHHQNGHFKQEITGVDITDRKGNVNVFEEDEEYKKVIFEKIPSLRPAFSSEGTVTAANASTINDGAASLILASGDAVKKLQLKPLARIVAFADAAQEPTWFTTTPALATSKALERSGWKAPSLQMIEVNEAFAVVPIVFTKMLDIDPEIVNMQGGAVALGHPLGASGARILVTLLYGMLAKHKQKGLATICNGGGGASAITIELE